MKDRKVPGACGKSVRVKKKKSRRQRRMLLTATVVLTLFIGLALVVSFRRTRSNVPTVVSVQAGRNVGSCVLYETGPDSYLFLTAAHVLEDVGEVIVTFPEGTVAGGLVTACTPSEDIGAFAVCRQDVPEQLQGKLKPAARNGRAYEALRQGTPVSCRGAKADGTAVSYAGTVGSSWRYSQEFDMCMLYLYCRADVGMSGGAALDGNGNFLGLILGGSGSETLCLPLAGVENWYKAETGRQASLSAKEG